MRKLVFDIETVGEDWSAMDETTQKVLTRWIRQQYGENSEEYNHELGMLKDRLGFSPLTGEVVALGIMDVEQEKSVVYYQSPPTQEGAGQAEVKAETTEEKDVRYVPVTEREMLKKFWDGATEYTEFISFNGRTFDVPFLFIRSAIHGIRPSKDLMRGRYLYQADPQALHVDLQDQLTFYGAMRRKGGLHMFARAFGIESPKAQGVTGDDVSKLYEAGRYLDIARYNVADLVATKELYDYWNEYLRF